MAKLFKTIDLNVKHKSKQCRGRSATTLIYFVIIGMASIASESFAVSKDIEFNSDILDLKDRGNIDLSSFSRAGYITPGKYELIININNNELSGTYRVDYIVPKDDPKASEPCISPILVKQFALRPEWLKKLTWKDKGNCLNEASLPGMSLRTDLGSGVFFITLPQAYLEYSSPNWESPSFWDEGIAGLLFDYNVNANVRAPSDGKQKQQITANGTAGANLGVWRFRADWQASYEHTTGVLHSTENHWNWDQFYLYRAITKWGARLVMGETYLRSNLLDNFRFTGISLLTDEQMLPPNLRGYAPEITGVAKTNAKVTVSQQGRIIYETQIAPGPFRIQDLHDAVSGRLDVRIEEQDGTIQEYQIDTANIPYLTRPGRLQYKVSAGKPSRLDHKTEGPIFAMGEFSWGVNNGWSLFGGTLVSKDYNSASLGFGRDLMMLGAISFDTTHSWATFANENKHYHGSSYRISYSKRFESIDGQITFAGYRFSDRHFMSMDQYLDRRYRYGAQENNKELYTLTLSKQFPQWGLSTYINYNHQRYWDRPNNDYYNFSLSKYLAIGKFKNINISLSAYRNRFNGNHDNGVYFNINLPWRDRATISYNSVINKEGNSHNVSYFDRIDDNNNYRLSAGVSSRGKPSVDGFFTHYGDVALVTASASHINGDYTSASLSFQGGATLTTKGGDFHRSNMPGATRLLIDTQGVSDVPVKSLSAISHTNIFGKAVIPDINHYYRGSASIDLKQLPDNVEALRSIHQLTLTEGAIGYRQFDVIAGHKAMATVQLAEGGVPPFAATVTTLNGRELGVFNDGGKVYLSGINSGDVLYVHWDGKNQCQLSIPKLADTQLITSLLLTCFQRQPTISTSFLETDKTQALPQHSFLSK
ncbi:PapC/FimD family outer membrane usher protein [Proteus mirabilis]|uniref:outer membrane usher protein n=1 Tax=Proteus mirabilis TaxID=584 RepID=UPI000CE06312|nr:outer membrane usher protein [Proteus mirabilis]AVA39242.1 PapC/FimD family outer membrane usher protein [Proteus mirabilis]ELB1102837.1 outer membrane usher protein [Proteus mirabilis]MBI6487062.1 outer membrane usher protein [Proteus mirabilis]MBN7149838.1 outer membrane usher protein [Proteus mirabilis]MBN7153589.1 outer membrane usher protein [Proteus mirabilis]